MRARFTVTPLVFRALVFRAPVFRALVCTTLVCTTLVCTVFASGCGSPAPAPVVRTRVRRPSASTLTVSGVRLGDTAPELTLEDQNGHYRALSDYRGRPLVLFFYPRTAPGECTPDACALRDAWSRLQTHQVQVAGISTDDAYAHLNYRNENDLPFDLLSDPDEIAAAAYGVPSDMGFITSRQIFLINAEGQVVDIWDNLSSLDEVLAAVDGLEP